MLSFRGFPAPATTRTGEGTYSNVVLEGAAGLNQPSLKGKREGNIIPISSDPLGDTACTDTGTGATKQAYIFLVYLRACTSFLVSPLLLPTPPYSSLPRSLTVTLKN